MFGIWKNDELNDTKLDSVSLYRFLSLNMKTIYSTWATRLVILLSPILVTLALASMMPLHYYVAAGQIFVTTLSAGTIWGMTYFSFRKSTLYDNIKGTRSSNMEMYLAIFLSMVIVTFCSEVLFWLSSIAFYYILPISFFGDILGLIDLNYSYEWAKMDWLTITYVWLMSVILMYMSSFTFRGIVNSEKNYFVLLFLFVMILFPFGGLLRPNLQMGDSIWFDHENGQTGYYGFQWASIVFPQTHLNYFAFASVSAGTIIDGSSQAGLGLYSSWQWSSENFTAWDFTIIYPLITCAVFGITSLLTIDIE